MGMRNGRFDSIGSWLLAIAPCIYWASATVYSLDFFSTHGNNKILQISFWCPMADLRNISLNMGFTSLEKVVEADDDPRLARLKESCAFFFSFDVC